MLLLLVMIFALPYVEDALPKQHLLLQMTRGGDAVTVALQ